MNERVNKHSIETIKTARYYTLNSVHPKTKNFWFVLHGYGQAAKHFLKHFRHLDPETNFFVAPEGLSRFYVEGVSGRVGASWLTKDDREDEISDQIKYLNTVAKDAGIDLANPKFNIILLGFSQGTASLVRWLRRSKIRAHAVILWAGSFPHDEKVEEVAEHLGKAGFHYAYGSRDPYLKDLDITKTLAPLSEKGLNVTIWKFDGVHTIDRETLQNITTSF